MHISRVVGLFVLILTVIVSVTEGQLVHIFNQVVNTTVRVVTHPSTLTRQLLTNETLPHHRKLMFKKKSRKHNFPREMISKMNLTVDPCQDFYKYACGGWMKKRRSTPGIEPVKRIDVLDQNNLIKDIIEGGNHPIVSELWESCMNIKQITELGNKPLEKDLKRIVEASTKESIMRLAGEFTRTGTQAFLEFGMYLDKETTLNTVYLNAVKQTLHTTNFYEDDMWRLIHEEFYQYIKELLEISGYSKLNDNGIKIGDMAKTIGEMERKFVMLKIFSLTTTTKQSIATAKGRWPKLLDSFLKGIQVGSKLHVNDDFNIYVNYKYMESLQEGIEKASLDDLKNYLAYTMIHSRVHWLGDSFIKDWFPAFSNAFKNMPKRKKLEREKFCQERIFMNLPDLIGKYVYEKADSSSKEKEMTELINDAMSEHLYRAEWSRPEDENLAQAKLTHLIPFIGYMDFSKSTSSIVSHDNFPTNMYRIMSRNFNLKMKHVGQHGYPYGGLWISYDIKANYDQYKNTIIFPTTILQPPYLNGPKTHPARNFGAIGTIMDHELSLAFENAEGSVNINGDKLGWSSGTSKATKPHQNCFGKQYTAVDKGKNVATELIARENIPDHGGVALAWDAYRKYMDKHMPSIKDVPSADGDKMFFISFGQAHCATVDSRMFLEKDTHYPPRERVNGVVMNNENFAKAFQCKEDAPMNPLGKCKVW